MKLRYLAVPAVAVLATLGMAGTAQAEMFRVECTRFPGAFPGADGGEIIFPNGMILANCRYPGPAEGGRGGADAYETYDNCVITPAGNFQCTGPHGAP